MSMAIGLHPSDDQKRVAQRKAERLCEVAGQLHAKANAYGKAGGMSWESGALTFTLTAPPVLRENGDLEVFVSAERGGRPLPLDGIDSFLFRNPPVGIRDEGTVVEDREAAFKAIVEEAVLTAARRRGFRE